MDSTALVTVYRQDPTVERTPTSFSYRLPLDGPTTVLQVLALIFEQYDPGLAYRRCNCYRGVCGACLLNINGKNLRACNILVKPGDQITLRPATGFTLIRDLVVDPSLRGAEPVDSDSTDLNARSGAKAGDAYA